MGVFSKSNEVVNTEINAFPSWAVLPRHNCETCGEVPEVLGAPQGLAASHPGPGGSVFGFGLDSRFDHGDLYTVMSFFSFSGKNNHSANATQLGTANQSL